MTEQTAEAIDVLAEGAVLVTPLEGDGEGNGKSGIAVEPAKNVDVDMNLVLLMPEGLDDKRIPIFEDEVEDVCAALREVSGRD